MGAAAAGAAPAAAAPVAAAAGAGAAAAPAEAPAAPAAPVMTNRQDPRYAPFFKMINVGVPIPAAKMKCANAGLDPDVLECVGRPFFPSFLFFFS